MRKANRHNSTGIALGRAKAIQVERFPRRIGEHNLPALEIDLPDKEARLFDLDLPPKTPELNDILSLFGKEADAAVKGRSQPGVGDGMTFVGPTTVVVKAETERAQRRGPGAHPSGSGSRCALPSGWTRNAPWKS